MQTNINNISVGFGDLYKLAHDIKVITPGIVDPVVIRSGLNIDLTIRMDLKSSSSWFSLTIYNLNEEKFERIETGSRIEITLGYSILYGGQDIVNIKKTVDIESIKFRGIIETTEKEKDQGDMAYTITGYDETHYKLKNYNKSFSMAFGSSGVTDLKVFVEELGKEVGIQIDAREIGQANMRNYSTRKEESAFQTIKRIALKYGMYFICKNGSARFVREIKDLNDNKYDINISYDNALLEFQKLEDEEPITVELEKYLKQGGLAPVGISRRTDTITTKSYHFKCLGVPSISVGDRISLQGYEDISNETRIKQAVNSLVNVIPRKKTTPVKVYIYSLKIKYANRHSGYYMEGKAVDINRKEGIERATIFGKPSEESVIDSVVNIIKEQVESSFPLSIGDNTGGEVNDQEEITQGATGIDKKIEDDPQASTTKKLEDKDFVLNAPYLTPFAGPSMGMILPNIRGSRNVFCNLDLKGLDIVNLGQLWFREWPKPLHDPNDYLVQNALVNLYPKKDLTSGKFVLEPLVSNITKFLMSAKHGTVGINARGFIIKIDPATGEAKFDLTGTDGLYTIEMGDALIEIDGTEITLTKGLTKMAIKTTGVEIT